MPDKTEKELIQELHQGVYGIPGTEEKGLIGDVKDLIGVIQIQNGRIGKNEQHISRIWGILIGVGAVGGTGLGFGIKTMLGG